MSEIDEQRFQSGNNSRICDRLFDVEDNKIRDHSHITGKYRGSDHWSFKNNLELTKKVSLIYHNLRGYGSNLNK